MVVVLSLNCIKETTVVGLECDFGSSSHFAGFFAFQQMELDSGFFDGGGGELP